MFLITTASARIGHCLHRGRLSIPNKSRCVSPCLKNSFMDTGRHERRPQHGHMTHTPVNNDLFSHARSFVFDADTIHLLNNYVNKIYEN